MMACQAFKTDSNTLLTENGNHFTSEEPEEDFNHSHSGLFMWRSEYIVSLDFNVGSF